VQAFSLPLVIKPLGELVYYEVSKAIRVRSREAHLNRYSGQLTYGCSHAVLLQKRKPVDVMSFVKSPYGLMIAFSLFIIVVMPKMKVRRPSVFATNITCSVPSMLMPHVSIV
jgi:hypothetical protein